MKWIIYITVLSTTILIMLLVVQHNADNKARMDKIYISIYGHDEQKKIIEKLKKVENIINLRKQKFNYWMISSKRDLSRCLEIRFIIRIISK